MGYYANQKTVRINKPDPQKGNARIIVDREQLEAAARELSGNEFKLYMFFASDNDGFKRDFSPAHFADVYGVSADTTRKLFKQLEEKGFIKQDNYKKNLYQFYLMPQEEYEFVEEKRLIKTVKGDTLAVSYSEVYEKFKGKHSEEEIKNYWNKLPVQEVE